MIINLSNISLDYGNKPILSNINLTLDFNSKAGLVGRNGTGKTSLLKIITGEIKPNDGTIALAKNYRIGYFSQETSVYADIYENKLWDFLYEARTELLQKKAELNDLEIELANTQNEKQLKKLHDLQIEYELLGGFTYENEIKSLLINFGFKPEDYYRQLSSFSGGEKTRLRLIKILLNRFDFILFDEPTNHLDLITVDWFIQYLKSLPCGYLIISHDRYLLDQTVNKIYELKNQKIEVYSGNYSSYEVQAKERETLLLKQYNEQQKLIKKTEDFIQRNIVRASTTNRAKSRLKMLNRLERITLDPNQKNIKINITKEKRSGNDVFRLENLTLGFENKILAKDVNLRLGYQDKICLIGANGSGKTTLLKILTGDLSPLSGSLWTGYSLTVGYYDQQHIDLDEDLTVLDTVWNLSPMESFGWVMSYLARFGFNIDQIEQKVSSLSGGEKSRMFLATLIHEKPNILILDEPTNHLDISMIKSLEQALINYDGTIIFVSHDRYFVQNITNDFWIIKDEKIIKYNGNFNDLIEEISPFMTDAKIKEEKVKSTSIKIKKTNPFILDKLLSQIDDINQTISQKEKEVYELQSMFNDKSFYAFQDNITKVNKLIETLNSEIKALTFQKEELENEYLNLLN